MLRFLRWIPIFATVLMLVACSSISQPKPPAKPVEYGYPTNYRVKSIKEQVSILRQHFPELQGAVVAFVPRATWSGRGSFDYSNAIQLPNGFGGKDAEGLFAIPQWQTIAPTYGEAVQRVFDALAKQRSFHNWFEGELGPEYLRQTEHTATMWKQLIESQNNSGILLVPAQFGLRHRGKSVLQARASFAENEFGLGVYEVGIMLLTHPERFQGSNVLWIDAAGDEYSLFASGDFSRAPFFCFLVGRVVWFDAFWRDDTKDICGSASAFVSQ